MRNVTLILKPNRDGQIGDGSPVETSGEELTGAFMVCRGGGLIVVFEPGRHVWSAPGRTRYVGAEYRVYRVEPTHDNGTVVRLGDREVPAGLATSWPARRPK